MAVLIFDHQFDDNCITGLPTGDFLKSRTRWPRGPHNTHQNQTRSGLHEETLCLQQEIGVAAAQTTRDTVAVDTSGVPPYLKRKLLGMTCNPLIGLAWMLTIQTDRTHRTSCNWNCKASGRTIALLCGTAVSDDDDWIYSDYSDDDELEDEAPQQQLGLGVGISPGRRNGEFPPRVRWLRRRHFLVTRRMATMKHAQPVQDGKDTVVSVLARPQTHWKDSSRSGKRKRTGTEIAETAESELHHGRDDSDGSIRKRRGLQVGSSAIIQRVEDHAASGGLRANTTVSPRCLCHVYR